MVNYDYKWLIKILNYDYKLLIKMANYDCKWLIKMVINFIDTTKKFKI